MSQLTEPLSCDAGMPVFFSTVGTYGIGIRPLKRHWKTTPRLTPNSLPVAVRPPSLSIACEIGSIRSEYPKLTLRSTVDRHATKGFWIPCGMDIGNRIKRARKAAGYSQEALGGMFSSDEKPEGLGKATVSAWETGRNELIASQIVKLCEVLCISADYLLTGKEPSISAKEQWIIDGYRSADETGRTVIETGVEMSRNLRGAGSLSASAMPVAK